MNEIITPKSKLNVSDGGILAPVVPKKPEPTDEEMEEYISKLEPVNQQWACIIKHQPKEKDSIIIDPNSEDTIIRKMAASLWGRLIKIYDQPITHDQELAEKRDNLKVGWYVKFDPANSIPGGNLRYPRVKEISIHDIFSCISPEDFEKYVEGEE